MRKAKVLSILYVVVLLAVSITAEAQQPKKIHRIGYLSSGGNSVDVRFNGRKENLHSLWDTALVELEQGTSSEIAKRIQAATTVEDRQQWQQGTPTI